MMEMEPFLIWISVGDEILHSDRKNVKNWANNNEYSL